MTAFAENAVSVTREFIRPGMHVLRPFGLPVRLGVIRHGDYTEPNSPDNDSDWTLISVMRLWTLHPRYLDAKGLVALWREGLLAQKVLQGGTKGYRHHPQLIRFLATSNPEAAIATYLAEVCAEATRRGYAFDTTKIARRRSRALIEATDGQIEYEWLHLRRKLRHRDPKRHKETRSIKTPEPHPLFRIVRGPVHDWERVME